LYRFQGPPPTSSTSSDKARLLQWNNADMMKLKRRGCTADTFATVEAHSVCSQDVASAMLSLITVSRVSSSGATRRKHVPAVIRPSEIIANC
jgi:hypothetical protein